MIHWQTNRSTLRDAGAFIIVALVLLAGNANAVTIGLSGGISFQNEGTTSADDTALLSTLDGSYASSTSGTVDQTYYATGTGQFYFDAASLNFDVSSVGFSNVTSAMLRFYTQKGDYATLDGTQAFNDARNSWEHYQILEGAFNATNQDATPFTATGTVIDFGLPGTLAQNTTVGWLATSVPTSWFTSNDFHMTLRLWNARIDAVELVVETERVPAPATLGLLALGFAGLGYRRRNRLKAA